MKTSIPRIEKTLAADKVGWFFVENDKGEREVFMGVPRLEGIGRLILHTIDAHGSVSPSVKITGHDTDMNPIEYHDHVILEGWPAGIVKGAGIQFIPAEAKESIPA